MTIRKPTLALYHKDYCPYCKATRKVIDELGLSIELRDIEFNKANRDALIANGGKQQVPCLRIENDNGNIEWMYESQDIIQYLRVYEATDLQTH